MLYTVLALESAVSGLFCIFICNTGAIHRHHLSGLALGFQASAFDVFILFLAIITHIWAEAFTISTAILKTKLPDTSVIKCVLSSLLSRESNEYHQLFWLTYPHNPKKDG
jgi:hypothetical protein